MSELMLVLESWGRKWAELEAWNTPIQGVVLWVWANFFLDPDRFPGEEQSSASSTLSCPGPLTEAGC